MIKISIIKNGQVTNSAQFPTQEEAEAWLSRHEAMGSFGAAGTYEVLIEDAVPSQAQINAEARAYLASTDWYYIRFGETGVPVPQEILDARAAARASIQE
jgi:hypothetical protein